MDLILTPLVRSLLTQYVKRSAEGAGSDLKVRRRLEAEALRLRGLPRLPEQECSRAWPVLRTSGLRRALSTQPASPGA